MNFELYEGKARDNLDAQIAAAWTTQIMVPTVDILTAWPWRSSSWWAATRCLAASSRVGVMVAYIFYVQRFFDPVHMLSMQYTIIAAGHGGRLSHLRGARRAGDHHRQAGAPKS